MGTPKPLSVGFAVSYGRWLVNIPLFFIASACLVCVLYLGDANLATPWTIAACLLVGALVFLLYRSVVITRWRVWAFKRVDDPLELYRKALELRILGRAGGWLEAMEIKSTRQREQLELIRKHILQLQNSDAHADDADVPAETVFRYSTGNQAFGLLFSSGVVAFGFWVTRESALTGAVIMAASGLALFVVTVGRLLDRESKITINADGIRTKNNRLDPWPQIENPFVIERRSSRSSSLYFIYDVALPVQINEDERRRYLNRKIDIGWLDVDSERLEHLIKVYRGRCAAASAKAHVG